MPRTLSSSKDKKIFPSTECCSAYFYSVAARFASRIDSLSHIQMISSLLCLSLFQMSTLLFSETPAANQKTGKGSKNFSFLKQAIEQNQESLKEYLAADHQEADQCVTVVQDVQSIVATDRFVPPRLANSMKGPQRNERQSKYRSLQRIIDKKKTSLNFFSPFLNRNFVPSYG